MNEKCPKVIQDKSKTAGSISIPVTDLRHFCGFLFQKPKLLKKEMGND